MNNEKLYVLGVCLLLGALVMPLNLNAQYHSEADNRLSLSLQEATEIALDQNFDIEQASYDVDKSRAQFRQTKAIFLPQLFLSTT